MSRDLRRYAAQTQRGALIGFVLLLVLVGDGLIYLLYGRGPALMGLVCVLAGLLPLLLIAVGLYAMEWVVKKNRDG
ncbi:MAG: hypothetical protein D6803_06250 [Anaerolineae bacterium]|nr:MAG: hypothetical protein D6803_06250 [Anaerolineae bacterium]